MKRAKMLFNIASFIIHYFSIVIIFLFCFICLAKLKTISQIDCLLLFLSIVSRLTLEFCESNYWNFSENSKISYLLIDELKRCIWLARSQNEMFICHSNLMEFCLLFKAIYVCDTESNWKLHRAHACTCFDYKTKFSTQ